MKIVLIGAGSFVFAPSVLHDAIIDHRLAGSEIVLVDLDADLLTAMAGVGRRMATDAGVDLQITATTDRLAALPHADFVILSAAIQGARRWRMDYEILTRAGIPDQSRECGGVGGIGYALRSITLALSICRDMERLCPQATLLDVTNPLPRVVSAVNRFTAIRAIGFCNVAWGGYPGYRWLAGLIGRSHEEIDVVTAGLNHFAWLASIRDRQTGEDLYPQVEAAIRAGSGPHFVILRRWLDEFGGIGVSGVSHMGEYLPVDPDNEYRAEPPFHGTADERQRRYMLLQAIGAGQADWRTALDHRSWERPVDVAVALGRQARATFDMVNIPNDGYLPQIPAGHVVEVPAVAQDGILRGRAVPPLPEGVAAICRAVSDVHETVAEAAVKGDRALAEHAIAIDPAITNKVAARQALAEMLQAHADILPQFR